MVTMLKMGATGTCDVAASALAKLELCNFGGATVTEIIKNIATSGNLA